VKKLILLIVMMMSVNTFAGIFDFRRDKDEVSSENLGGVKIIKRKLTSLEKDEELEKELRKLKNYSKNK
jgi:hypothetical protein